MAAKTKKAAPKKAAAKKSSSKTARKSRTPANGTKG